MRIDRHMKYATFTLIGALAASALSGCLRDDLSECPQLTVEFGVKDRLYDKGVIDLGDDEPADVGYYAYEDPHAAATSFSQLIPTLYYVLFDGNGNAVREAHLTNTDNGELCDIKFDDDLPFGKYTLTAWGALADESALSNDASKLDLSNVNHEVYTVSADIDFRYDNSVIKADFLRATGMVVIDTETENFPKGIDAAEITFSGLYSEVSKDLQYNKSQQMTITQDWNKAGKVARSYIALPPSSTERPAKIHVKYYNKTNPSTTPLVPDDRALIVERNKITYYLYKFDPYTKDVRVYIMVDGRWQEIHGMHVD